MFELNFAKEPFNMKLFIICFIKKIWLVICGALIGAILIGGANYLKKVVWGGPKLYEIETSYYVNYHTDIETGQIITYINEATWESWITMDWFTDRIWAHASELGLSAQNSGITRENLQDYLWATLLTDVHIPTTYVTAETPAEVQILNEAVKLTFMDFAEHQEEMRSVEVIDESQVREKNRDDRTVRACILGAVLGAFAVSIVLAFKIISDDTILVSETFAYRYGLPMLGALCKGEKQLSEEATVNLAYLFKKEQAEQSLVALECGVEFDGQLPQEFQIVKEQALSGAYEQMRNSAGVLLLIGSGKYSGKKLEHLLHNLKIQDCPVRGALLCDADRSILRMYYGRKCG